MGTSTRLPASPGVIPISANRSRVTRSALSRDATWAPAPLCRIARENSPRAAGTASRAATLMAPADSPKTVTCDGSPPNDDALAPTHSSAAT